MMSFFSWLAGTRAGRNTIALGAAFAALFFAILKIFSAGKASEKAKQDRATIEALSSRSKIDDETSKMDDAAVRRELSRWVQRNSDNS